MVMDVGPDRMDIVVAGLELGGRLLSTRQQRIISAPRKFAKKSTNVSRN
jgi:hypothetical protein